MQEEHDTHASPRPRGISRRDFIRLATAGLLAGCSSAQHPEPTPVPTDIPTPIPRASGKVVQVHHANVWDGETLVPDAIRQMLDVSIARLTGLDDAGKAWAALFDPSERIAIKVNTIATSSYWTHVPVVMAVTDRLQEAGVPAEQIVIFDRSTRELDAAGYSINQDGPGVRCYGADLNANYTPGWTLLDTDVGLSNILLNCDALINMPILKSHSIAGCTFAMKNHYGTFNKPQTFHRQFEQAIVELNALEPIRERTRLIIGDALTICTLGWRSAVTRDSILMSFDPVAHDTIGLLLLAEAIASEGIGSPGMTSRALSWLEKGAELGLGISEPDDIEWVDLTMG